MRRRELVTTTSGMRRRRFIALAGAALAAPGRFAAAQPAAPPTIGFLGTASRTAWQRSTAAFVESIPGIYSAGYSILDAGSFLPKHRGLDGGVLRCHLGLVIPEDSGINVAGEIRTWAEGKTLVFDDTTEHESWNRSSRAKVLLLIDFAKPRLFDGTAQSTEAQRTRDHDYYRSLFPEWV